MGQSVIGMKNRRKARFKIHYAILAEVFGLFIGYALSSLLGLHDRDSVREALKIFGQASTIRAPVKPLRQRLRISCWKISIPRILRQFNNALRPQNAVQMRV